MRTSALRHIAVAMLASLLIFGSVAYSYAASVHKTEVVKQVQLDVFANDAYVIEVPANKIGFHTYAYMLNAGTRNEIRPVAHAPPNSFCNISQL